MRRLATLQASCVAVMVLAYGIAAATAQTPEPSTLPPVSDDLSGGATPERFLFFSGLISSRYFIRVQIRSENIE